MGFRVQYRKGMTNPGPPVGQVVFCNSSVMDRLTPFKVYSIRVQGFTSKGVGPLSGPVVCVTQETGMQVLKRTSLCLS